MTNFKILYIILLYYYYYFKLIIGIIQCNKIIHRTGALQPRSTNFQLKRLVGDLAGEVQALLLLCSESRGPS